MKILLVNDAMNVGGAETYILKLAKALSTKGHRVIIAANGGEFVSRVPAYVEFHEIMLEGKNPLQLSRSIRPLVTLIKQGNINLIHTNAVVPMLLIRLALAISKLNIPVVATVHKIWEKETRVVTRVLAGLIYSILKISADHVITLNSLSYNKLRNAKPSTAKIALIYNGIEANNHLPKFDAKNKKQINRAVKQIIYAGRLVEQKRVDLMLLSLEHVRRQTSIKCLIVGDGPLRSDLEALSLKLDLGRIVQFLGYQKDVAEILRNSDLFIVTSQWEGISFSMLEALQHGLPIVGFDSAGIKDVVEHGKNGLLVPFGQTVALAQAIETVLTDNELYGKLRAGARTILEERFLLDKMIDSTLGVYSEALMKSGSALNVPLT